MSVDTNELVRFVRGELEAAADPEKAVPMAAYMKTEMPFYGVQKPGRARIMRELVRSFAPRNAKEWERAVLALWRRPYREEKYIAIDYATAWKERLEPASLPLAERLIREGAWWDLVDAVIGGMVSPTLLRHRADVKPVMDRWLEDEDMWIRRAALLSQLKHKQATDEEQLFGFCLRRAHEKEFFIRKAIGWALRDYSWTRPESVKRFLLKHRGELSNLSFREGGKRLRSVGLLPER